MRAILRSFFHGSVLALLMAGAAGAEVHSELRASTDSFLSPAYDEAGPESTQFFGAAFSNTREDDAFRIDLRGAYSSASPLMSHINVKELAYTIPLQNSQSFAIGRKKEKWSELDRRWTFGLVEPVFKWNPLAPESQGLSGLFWHVGEGNVKFSLFGSMFYVPEQGPNFEIDSEGRFVRGHPWFRRPPESVRIFSSTIPIEYSFDRPREADIVFQPSYGAKIEFFEETSWLWRVSGFYKPMNQLALGYNGGVLDIPRDRGLVDVQPAVVYHQVLASDLVYEQKRFRLGVSAVQDKPSSENPFPAEWTRPVFEPALLGTAFFDVRLTNEWILTLQHMGVDGGEIKEEGTWANPERASVTSRYPYFEASAVALDFMTRLPRSRSLQVKTSYMWSRRNSFQLVRLEGRLDVTKDWSLQSELSLVEAKPLDAKNRNDIGEFRNNDRLALGVGYAF